MTNVVSLVNIQVCVHISLVCTPDRASHARPCLLEGKNTLDIVAVNFFAGDGVDDRRLDAEEGEGCRTWLSGCDASKRSDNVRAGLSLPVCLDVRLVLAYSFFRGRIIVRPQLGPPPFQQLQNTTSRLQQQLVHRQSPRLASASSDS